MSDAFAPVREPLSATLARNIGIAVVVGATLGWRYHSLTAFAIFAAQAFWPSFGGHWIDLFFLNWLRMRIPQGRFAQIVARLAVWFAGGNLLALGLAYTLTLSSLTRDVHLPPWWILGCAFIMIELIAHAAIGLRGAPNFYNGRG